MRNARVLLTILILLSCLSASLFAQAQTCTATDPPHVVYIMMDDLGYGSLGAYGSGDAGAGEAMEILTPKIDLFAEEACRWTQYYVSAAVCSPSRVTFLTGQDPRTFNVRGALATGKGSGPFSDGGIPNEVLTLPEMFRQAQYRTVHIGKWHVGGIEKIADGVEVDGEFTPAAMGFSEWWVRVPSKSRQGVSGYWLEWVESHLGDGFCLNCLPGQDCSDKCRGTGRPTDGIHLTKHFVDLAIDVVSDFSPGTPPNDPLFLNLWLRAPHSPYNSPQVLDNAPAADRYKGLVEYADEQIGRLLVEIEEHLGSNTLVFITSDNGAANRTDGGSIDISATFPNGDLAGKKGSLMEGGLRVPMMIQGPGIGCSESSFPGASFDLFPTLADVLGCDVSAEDFLGQSLAAQLANPATAPQERDRLLFHEGGRGLDAVVRDGPWKYHGCRPHDLLIDMSDCGGATCDEGQSLEEPFLFNPSCRPTDASVDNPVVVERLKDLFLDWRETTTEIEWSSTEEREDLRVRGQIFEFSGANSTGGQFKLCTGEDCRLDDPLFNFHDRSLMVSLKVRPDEGGFGHPGANAWLVGKSGSWNLVMTPTGYARVNFTVELDGEPHDTFTVTSAQPLEVGQWNHLLLDLGARVGTSVGADLYLNGVQDSFVCNADQGIPPNPDLDQPPGCSKSEPEDPNCVPDEGVPPNPVLDEPTNCSIFEAIASNSKPMILGSIQDGNGGFDRPFYGDLSDLRFFTTQFYWPSPGNSEQVDRLFRQEISHQIASDLVDGGALVYDGDVLRFDRSQVKLCALDEADSCTTSHPILDPQDGPWTFSAAIRPAEIPTSGQRMIAGKNDSWRLYLLPNGVLRVQIVGGCANCLVDTDPGMVSEDEWSHLALVLGPISGGQRTVDLYVDGVLAKSSSPLAVGGGTKTLVLGARGAGGNQLIETFDGEMAAVRLFFDALDPQTLARLGRDEVPWKPVELAGSVQVDREVFFFPQEDSGEADQIIVCGPDHPPISGLEDCPSSDYERFNVAGGSLSVSIDVRPTIGAPVDFARILGKDSSWQLHRDIHGFLKLKVFPQSGGAVTVAGPYVPEGVWSTVGFRLEPQAGSSPPTLQATVYLVENGQEIGATNTVPIPAPVGFAMDKKLVLGSHAEGKRFHGAMKNLRIYRRSIDSNEARLLGIREAP